MAYKTILVCLNEINRLEELVNAAVQLGTKFKAHISGLYVIPAIEVYSTDGYSMAAVFDGRRVFFQNHKDKVVQAFRSAMKHEGLSFDTHVVDSNIPNIGTEVLANSREADLVVISNTDRKAPEGIESNFVENFVVAAGRPVLVLPSIGKIDLKIDQVMIGWSQTREASRAVFDALPFLAKAKLTRLVGVDVAPKGQMPAARIAETLDRHGIKAEITNVSSDGMVTGETLLRATEDYGANLLVIGAYGHGRFAEMVFGGVTRYILREMNIPVLMSH